MIKNLLTPVLIGFSRTIFTQNSIFQEASEPEDNSVFNCGDESTKYFCWQVIVLYVYFIQFGMSVI